MITLNKKTIQKLENPTNLIKSPKKSKEKYHNTIIIILCAIMIIISPILYIIDFLCVGGLVSIIIFYTLMLGLFLLLIKTPNSKFSDFYKKLILGLSIIYSLLLPILMLISSENLGGLEFFIDERIYQYIVLETIVLLFFGIISTKFASRQSRDNIVEKMPQDQIRFSYFNKKAKYPLYFSLILRIFWLVFFETRQIGKFAANQSFLKVEYVVLASIPIFIAIFILDLNKFHLGLIMGIVMGSIHLVLVIFLVIMQFNPGIGPIIVITSCTIMIVFSIIGLGETAQKNGKIPKMSFVIMRIVLKLRRNPKKIQEILKTLELEQTMKVLDYGCDIGSYSIEAAKILSQNGIVHAVDFNKKMIDEVKKMAKKNGFSNITTYLIGNVEELKENDFDLIILNDVIHLFEDKPKLINSLLEILSENGKIFVNFQHINSSQIESILEQCCCSTKKNLSKKNWCLFH